VAISTKKKVVAVFDPSERSRNLVKDLLDGMGYQAMLYRATNMLKARVKGSKAADLVIVNLSLWGEDYKEVVEKFAKLNLSSISKTPMIVITSLKISLSGKERLEELGASLVLSLNAPMMELVFGINRLLFAKMRELRKYARVFGGFPIEYEYQGEWKRGEVYNISRQGAFVQCDDPPPGNTRLKVRFILPDQQNCLNAAAYVNWVNETLEGSKEQFTPKGMGVFFLSMNKQEDETLRRFVDQRTDENN
jgi:CheY-like chemotaxis protein